MDDRKRRWFQLHLSTCVVMMFVAGTLLGLNLMERKVSLRSDGRLPFVVRGFPIASEFTNTFYTKDWMLNSSTDTAMWQYAYLKRALEINERTVERTSLNVVCCFIILAATAFACEWWIRRRARAKNDAA